MSIDYLLDDGTKLDFSTTRKPILLAAIDTLIGEEKLAKGEKAVDTHRNARKEYYINDQVWVLWNKKRGII